MPLTFARDNKALGLSHTKYDSPYQLFRSTCHTESRMIDSG